MIKFITKKCSAPIAESRAIISNGVNTEATFGIPQKGKIQSRLLQWFKKNRRDLPWRKASDPYAIWVSEIMLQQTQVATVIPYYQKFLKNFPTLQHLAKANLSKVLKIWEGLGYYSRARNIHLAAQIVLSHFRGKIPDNLKDLLSLPGIGRSTAGSILSFAYNKEAPVLDGNAKRVLSRLFAISTNLMKSKTERLLWQISEALIPKGHANSFNQALMDLGSMICTPKDPQCPRCPLRHFCAARASGEPETFPLKRTKKKIPDVEAISVVIENDGKVLLNQRAPKGFLGGLWQFPNWKIEERRRLNLTLGLRNHIKKETGLDVEVKELIGTFRQTYSHFKLTLHVYHCQTMNGTGEGRWVSIQNLHLLPMSRIHRRIAETIVKRSQQNPLTKHTAL
jgi:A/G-specific adenine glycosylase